MDRVHKLIDDKLVEKRLSMKAASKLMGRNEAYLHQFFTRGVPKNLPEPSREALAPLLGVTPDELRPDGASPTRRAHAVATPTAVSPNVRVEGLVGLKDLPVFRSTEGGPTGAIVYPETIDETVSRPEPLLNAPGGFAIYVVGDSMVPAYEEGDLALIHPSRPPIRNDDVLLVRVESDNEWHAVIKRLMGFDQQNWRVKQYEPKKEYKLPRKEWTLAFVVVGVYRR